MAQGVRFNRGVGVAFFTVLILSLNGCGGDNRSTPELAPPKQPIKPTEETIKPTEETFTSTAKPNNWEILTDEVDDFGDRQVIFVNKKINSVGNTFTLHIACTAGSLQMGLQTDFYIIDPAVFVFKINGGKRGDWKGAKYSKVSDGTYLATFENGEKLFQKIKSSQTFSVGVAISDHTFYAFKYATFDLEGISELHKKLSTAGCNQ